MMHPLAAICTESSSPLSLVQRIDYIVNKLEVKQIEHFSTFFLISWMSLPFKIVSQQYTREDQIDWFSLVRFDSIAKM